MICRNQSYKGKINRPRKRVNIPCEWCGIEFERHECNVRCERNFCSRKCSGAFNSEFKIGASHPSWRGGYDQATGRNGKWRSQRRKAVIAAKGICQKCKKEKGVDVHHKLPVRYFDVPSKAHFQENLIFLCKKCHKEEHRNLALAIPLLEFALKRLKKVPAGKSLS